MTTATMEFPVLQPDLLDKPAQPAPAVELVDVADITAGKSIVKLNATEAGLAALRKDLAGKTYDLTTTKGDKAARDDRLRCVKLRTALETKRKELKAPAVEFGKMIDAEAKRITDEVLALESPIDAAIKDDEERRERERQERARIESERVAKLQAGVATIRNYVQLAQSPGMTAERIAKGIAALEGMAFSEDAWQEFAADATKARDESLVSLKVLHAGALEREAQAKRQAEEAERLAAEKADLDRRAAELAALEAAAKLEREQEAQQQEAAAKSQRETEAKAEAEAKAKEYTEGQANQQVLKAEPATADATDRVEPAAASPVGGPMGAGQAAAADPAVSADPLPTLLRLIRHARETKFSTQPKMGPEWWSQVYAAADALEVAA